MKSNEWFSESSRIAKALFILIVFYVVCAVPVLLLAAGVIDNKIIYNSTNPDTLSYVLIGISTVSFVFVVLIIAFHLSTLIRRRKRKSDLALQPVA